MYLLGMSLTTIWVMEEVWHELPRRRRSNAFFLLVNEIT